jgi:hypothetical protein
MKKILKILHITSTIFPVWFLQQTGIVFLHSITQIVLRNYTVSYVGSEVNILSKVFDVTIKKPIWKDLTP